MLQPAVPPQACAKEEGLEVYALCRHAGRLREGRVRLPAPRSASVDLVLSGINHGSNSAVSAALFGHDGRGDRRKLLRLSCSIGLSLDRPSPPTPISTAARMAYGRRIVRDVLEHHARAAALPQRERSGRQRPTTLRGIRALPAEPQAFWREEFVPPTRTRTRQRSTSGSRAPSSTTSTEAEETDEWALEARLRLGTARAGGPDGLPAHEGNAAALRPIAGERRTVPRRRTAHEGGNTPVEYNV